MAEFPDLGQQCSQCNTLDFLPLICDSCKAVFCKEHHSVVSHNCPEYESKTVSNESNSVSILGKCAFCRQSVPDTELVLCDKCNANHCLSHRHYVSHKCSKNKTEDKPKTSVPKPMINTSAPNIKGTKNEGLALKVALMKLKQKASGQSSVPMDERLYFKMMYQRSVQQTNWESKEVFLCKEWSIGKCIDWLASHFSLINNNNNPSAPKLVLMVDTEEDQILSMSKTLKQLESETLLGNGDTLRLKYVQL